MEKDFHIALVYQEPIISSDVIDGFEGDIQSPGLKVLVEPVPMMGARAGLEWLMPTAIVAYITNLISGHFMKKLNILITILSVMFFCISYSAPVMSDTEKQNIDSNVFIKCKEPRPEICTREYNPVCATRYTGIVCVTTPCPSTEEITYATGCTACADPKVIKYKQGECEK